MCDIWKKRASKEMSLEEIRRVFSQLKSLDAVRISGGEPFLRGDIAEIVNIINKTVKPKIIHLTTNGTLTGKILSFIKESRDLSNLHIKISIDAFGDEHDRIRGSEGAYLRAMLTLAELVKTREKYGFYLGVNQTITSPRSLADHEKIREICEEKNVQLFSEFATPVPQLYRADGSSNQREGVDDIGAKMPSSFSRGQIADALRNFNNEASKINNFFEKAVEKYYLKGLQRLLFKKRKVTVPRCVELGSHLRILPNGDVPVCPYRPTIVDNLLNPEGGDFKAFWFSSKKLKKQRETVSCCQGCWERCEAIPNGIYTGDIIRAII